MPRTDINIEEFKQRLLEERRKAVEDQTQAESIFEESQAESNVELNTYDDHQADIASDLTFREQQTTLADNINIVVELTDRALAKIEDGTYGLCDLCTQPIDVERLDFEPYAVHCLNCQKQIEGTE